MQQFKAFVLAAERLSAVARGSQEFGSREKDAATALYRNGLSAASIVECRQAFNAAYRVLGAPGDWGYHTTEGEALKGLYDA